MSEPNKTEPYLFLITAEHLEPYREVANLLDDGCTEDLDSVAMMIRQLIRLVEDGMKAVAELKNIREEMKGKS